jgi:signal transduction histidine kinase
MFDQILLYLELLLFLVGTLLYGFLTRELLRRPEVLAGNWPARALLVCLAVWYAGTLADYLAPMLSPAAGLPAGIGTALDLARGLAWLASLSLLVHTLARILTAAAPDRRALARVCAAAGYLPLLLFAGPALAFARTADSYLAPATQAIYPRIIAHAAVTLGLAGLLTARLTRELEDRRLLGFLRWLAAVLAGLLALLVFSGFFEPWSADASPPERLLRTLLLGGLLLPGGLLAFYVQRYNLLRLSLSHRSLRHFLGVLLLAALAMLAGPAAGMEDLSLLDRLVAWGLLLALFLGTAYTPLSEWAMDRVPALRSLLGKNVSPRELDRLMDVLQNLDGGDGEALTRTAAELGRWLGSDAEFLPPAAQRPELAPFWDFFADSDARVVHRLAPPDPRLASLLARQDLHAVFPLRVEGRLEGLLALGTSPTGGGYADGELEAVRLAIRQLAATLALRRLMRARVAEERRLGEQERLSLLGLISASLAHEIKNPLSSMKALAQALREDLAGADPQAEGVADLDLIVEQIDRLDQTAREILGIARPRPGDVTDLTALVESAVYVLRAEARKRGVEIDAGEVDEVGEVPGSEAQWQTVLFNLVLNAVEHTDAGASVHVRLHAAGGEVRFETANPGAPLDAGRREAIFEPFVSDGGTGLGLALVARRLREIGGRVDVRCEDGKVTFIVKVTTTAESWRSAAEDQGGGPKGGGPKGGGPVPSPVAGEGQGEGPGGGGPKGGGPKGGGPVPSPVAGEGQGEGPGGGDA